MLKKIGAWIKEWIIGEELPASTAHILPLLVAGGMLAGKLAKGWGQIGRASCRERV